VLEDIDFASFYDFDFAIFPIVWNFIYYMNPHNTIPNNLVGFVEIQSMQPKASLNSTWLLERGQKLETLNILTFQLIPNQ
jgi:hypothetical protein